MIDYRCLDCGEILETVQVPPNMTEDDARKTAMESET